MEFGIFDHLDRNGQPLHEFYEQRLRLAELYDRGGFRSYHIAEHHATPLGMATSPGLFAASLAQRTERLRFGPLVYTLPLYHPVRLAEEICMLDQLSGGRLELGFGKGISPIETAYFGVDPADRDGMTAEALTIVLQAVRDGRVDFEGRYYRFRDVPLEVHPLQTPHPPLWQGVHNGESAARAAANGANVVSVSTVDDVRTITDAYRAAWSSDAPLPLLGLGRFVIVAPTDDEALAIARRTYPKWYANFYYLFDKFGKEAAHKTRQPEFDQIKDGGRGIAGSPETVARMLRDQLTAAGANYFVGQFAFGDLTYEETSRTIELFVREVMPAVREAVPAISGA